LTAFLLLFWGLGGRGLWGSEGRWAEVTREMFLTHDFFHPSIGGEPYFDKPLLTYWLIVAITALTGKLNEWVVRIPSAAAGMAALWATWELGRRLWSLQVGRIAAWILLTSYGFLFWSRTAAADMENLAAIIAAVAWYWSQKDQPNFISFFVFYLILFLGALTKGLTAVVVPLLVILPDLFFARRWRMLFAPAHWIALLFGCIIYLAPFVYAAMTQPDYHASGIGLVFRENIVRFFEPFDHKEPVYIYLYQLPLLFLPWAPILVAAVAGSAGAWKELDYQTRWLLGAMALIFLFFTLSGSRRSYYILPILPFCALLVGVFLQPGREMGSKVVREWGVKIQQLLLLAMVVANLLMPLALPIIAKTTGFAAPPMLYAACAVTGLSAFILAWWLHRYMQAKNNTKAMQRIGVMILAAVVAMGGFFGWQHNILDTLRTERAFLLQLKSQLDEQKTDRIGIYPRTDAKVSFYLNRAAPLQIIKEAQEVEAFIGSQQPGVLLVQGRKAAGFPPELLTRLEGARKMAETVHPWESKSNQKEKWLAWFLPPR